MTVVERNNVRISGNGLKTMLFALGFGCDQNMWRYMTPAFEESYRVVLFDHVGAGNSDIASYNREKYGTLDGFAVDVLEICDELRLKESPRYINDDTGEPAGVSQRRSKPLPR